MTIRDTLAKPMLELLGDFVNLTRDDKDAVLELQAHLLAIHWAQIANPEFAQKDLCKAPRLGGKNRLMLEAEMTRLGVTDDDVEKARRMVIARTGMPAEVPLAGKIAVDMELTNGLLLDALVCAQAGESMLQAAERIVRLGGKGALEALPHLITDRADPQQIARNYIGKYDDDSQAAISAQACAHMADIAAALAGADEGLAAIIRAAGQAALRTAAYKMVALHHLSDARDMMAMVPDDGIDLTEDMAERWESFVTAGLSDSEIGEALLRRRLEQADLSLLLNADGQSEELGLKDALRKRLSSAK